MPKRKPNYIEPVAPVVEQLCGGPADTAIRYGIGTDKLRRLRTYGDGPPFRIFGHRTVVYPWKDFELWLNNLPGGGGVRTNRAK
jgi:hypothetical protein